MRLFWQRNRISTLKEKPLRPLNAGTRLGLATIIGVAGLSAAAFLPNVALAQETADTRTQAERDSDERAKLEDIERRLEARRKEEAQLRNQAKAREREVKALRFRMVETADALQDAERRIAAINKDLALLEEEEATLTQDLRVQRAQLGDVLGALQSLERSQPPAILVSPDDAANAARTAMLLADAAPTLEAKATAVRENIEKLQEVRDSLAAERENAERANTEIGDRRRVLAELLTSKQKERDVAQRLAAAAQSETAALAARASTLSEVINRLDRLARSITPRLKPPPPSRQHPPEADPARPAGADRPAIADSRPNGGANPNSRGPVSEQQRDSLTVFKPNRAFTTAQGALKAPVVGEIIGKYGDALPGGAKFDGLRFQAGENAIVTAPFQASVRFARTWNPIGNLIVLDVGQGYHILLMGVGAFLVEEGQVVSAGEPIGAMTGDSSVLDMEIRKNRVPVNPLLWLSRENEADAS